MSDEEKIIKIINHLEPYDLPYSTDDVYIAIKKLLDLYLKEKEKNKEAGVILGKRIKICNEFQLELEKEKEKREKLEYEALEAKEYIKRLKECHLQYEEMTGIDLLLPSKEE